MTPSSWPIAAFATSLPGDLAAVLAEIAALGFTHVDLVAEVERPAAHREALADSGLLVSCMALGRNLPAGHTLDAADVGVRRATLDLLRRQLADAACLGATTAYLVPGFDLAETALTCFAEGCALLADHADSYRIRLCVEHVPGRALPAAARTLDWLEQVGHVRLGMLLDVGHCLISNEDAAAVVRRAGARLGYVHLDDNDGVGDLHWPLFTGRLTRQQLMDTMAALRTIHYGGVLALELNPANPRPADALRDGKALVEFLSPSPTRGEGVRRQDKEPGTMPRKRKEVPLSQRDVPDLIRGKARPPLAVVLGSPAEVVHCLGALGGIEATCYQMDLHQAERLRAELAEQNVPGQVVTAADLWDLPADFQTVLYLPPRGGERELKIDMIEQAFHILRPHGTFVVWSPYETDPFFPTLLKKVFGRVHAPTLEGERVLWCQREGDRPRRRHEMTFQARVAGGPACRFLSRPGVFSYGRFDNGARALAETMQVRPGDRVLDLGCGCGTNGTFAAQHAGPEGHITFVDSNVRAVALAEINAHNNGVAAFQAVASSRAEGLDEKSFDVVLANPPYYANSSIARLFIERSAALLKPDGRFYLVTRQPAEVADWMMETFDTVGAMLCRGYTILCNTDII